MAEKQNFGATASQSLAVEEYDLKHALAVASRVDGVEAKLTALLHDAVEDGACTLLDLEEAELPVSVVHAVQLLTRGNESYRAYIKHIRDSGDDLAIYVKHADVEANLARMDAAHASLTGRYESARRVLTGLSQTGHHQEAPVEDERDRS